MNRRSLKNRIVVHRDCRKTSTGQSKTRFKAILRITSEHTVHQNDEYAEEHAGKIAEDLKEILLNALFLEHETTCAVLMESIMSLRTMVYAMYRVEAEQLAEKAREAMRACHEGTG